MQTENLSPFGQEVLSDAEAEVVHMQKLLEQLLTLARADQQITLRKEKVNLSQLTETTVQKFQRLSPLPIKSMISPNLYVMGNEDKLRQVLYILFENALRYTQQGTISLTVTKQGIILHDSGIGINAKDLPHIFERFYRSDEARAKGGTGLGLAIAQTIITQHNGTITASSEQTGTVFTISLPIFS